jgi:flavin reductase (DIM6/NTAB) family NADH-FMN oxidoreductase RutF
MPSRQLHQLLVAAVAPRPVGLVSTMGEDGTANLAPFSFFGLFSLSPPVVVFSPSRRVRDGSVKHTLDNLKVIPECIIHLVEEQQVWQMNLCANEYGRELSEFEKAGFTREQATMVQPFLVKECRVKMECRVRDIIALGNGGGAGSLVICDIVYLHIADKLLAADGNFNIFSYAPIARLGGDWYTRLEPAGLFELTKPARQPGIGMDRLPAFITEGNLFTKNQLAKLASVEAIPEADETFRDERIEAIRTFMKNNEPEKRIAQYAADLLEEGRIAKAWQVLLTLIPVNAVL